MSSLTPLHHYIQESSKDLAPSSFAFAPNKVAQIAFCDIKTFYYGAKIIFAP